MAQGDPERRAATRRRIVDAFWELRATLPTSQIKVRAVASAAGVSRTTFYKYFESVPDLQAEAEAELVAEMRAFLDARLEGIRGFDELRASGVQTELCERFAPRLGAALGVFEESSFVTQITEALRPATLDALGLDPQEASTSFVADTLVGYVLVTLVQWQQHGRPVPADELTAYVSDVAVNGYHLDERAGGAAAGNA